ncbi:hypothetical protein BDV36DRAFT_280243 [Aspergillus pseudocaelatus]|uniref:Protein kinase domain-containing protein n=1 Tax=Aspergillus pseudocaelatus TaxID=1825620 RepID=A0ABQ6WXY2_9EURO|nr:hypothetical protein BDV36DRAFT_280243 [Aspergillus pseudocaelatus]
MSEHPADLLAFDPSSLQIGRELKISEASSIFEVELHEHRYAMKVFHDNGDPGFTEKGRNLNRFRCELNAYRNLQLFQPHLSHFMNDSHGPTAILPEHLHDPEELNSAIVGLRGIHGALIHHRDVYPKNILIIRGPPERVVWKDFDVAVTFDSMESMEHQDEEYCSFEIELKEDQRQGFLPNTKYY